VGAHSAQPWNMGGDGVPPLNRKGSRHELEHRGACYYGNAVEYSWPKLIIVSLGFVLLLGAMTKTDPQLRQYSAEMGIGVAVPDRQRLLSLAVQLAPGTAPRRQGGGAP
jgi:hypothetical protein